MENLLFSPLFLLLLGFFSGFLINLLSDSLPFHKAIWSPVCDNCEKKQTLDAYLLGRKCMDCQHPKCIRFWLVRYLTPILFLFLPIANHSWSEFWIVSSLTTYFILILVIDIEHRLILNPLIICGLFLGLLFGFESIGLAKSLMGGITAFLIFLIVFYLGKILRGIFGNKFMISEIDDPIGFGDVYLAGITGLVLGWPEIFFGLFVAVMSAGIFSALYILIMLFTGKYRPFSTIPYGPFLIVGMVFALGN